MNKSWRMRGMQEQPICESLHPISTEEKWSEQSNVPQVQLESKVTGATNLLANLCIQMTQRSRAANYWSNWWGRTEWFELWIAWAVNHCSQLSQRSRAANWQLSWNGGQRDWSNESQELRNTTAANATPSHLRGSGEQNTSLTREGGQDGWNCKSLHLQNVKPANHGYEMSHHIFWR